MIAGNFNKSFQIKIVGIVFFVFLHFLLAAPVAFGQEDDDDQMPEYLETETSETPESNDDEKAIELFKQAQDAHEKGDLDLALKLYDEALKLLPEFPEALYQKASILDAKGDGVGAENCLRNAVELRPDWTLGLAALGSQLIKNRKLTEAKEFLDRAIRIDPLTSPAYVSLTDLYEMTRPPESVLKKHYSALVFISSKAGATSAVWAARATVERLLGSLNDASESLKKSFELDPGNKRAKFAEVEIALAGKEYDKAAELGINLKRLFPADTGVSLLAVRALIASGRMSEAKDVLDRMDGSEPAVTELRALLETELNKDPAVLEAALEKDPENIELIGGLCSLLRTSDPRKALDYCRRAYGMDSSRQEFAIGFGAALVRLKDYPNAIKVLEELKRRFPETHAVRANLATAYFHSNLFEKAKEEYSWIIKTQPDLPAAYYFMAVSHDRLKEFADAMANYQTFLKLADEATFSDEIGRVNLRLPSLRRQLAKSKE
ncbi:MAG: tetratricopeptide repeat protein [Pyrinomonadaceae bacterium]